MYKVVDVSVFLFLGIFDTRYLENSLWGNGQTISYFLSHVISEWWFLSLAIKGISPSHHWRLVDWSRHYPSLEDLFIFFRTSLQDMHDTHFFLFSSQSLTLVQIPGHPQLGGHGRTCSSHARLGYFVLTCSYQCDMIVISVWDSQLAVISKYGHDTCQKVSFGGNLLLHMLKMPRKGCRFGSHQSELTGWMCIPQSLKHWVFITFFDALLWASESQCRGY